MEISYVDVPEFESHVQNMKRHFNINSAYIIPSTSRKECYLIGEKHVELKGVKDFRGEILRGRVNVDGTGEYFSLLWLKLAFKDRMDEIGNRIVSKFYQVLENERKSIVCNYPVPTYVISWDGILFEYFDNELEKLGYVAPFDELYQAYKKFLKKGEFEKIGKGSRFLRLLKKLKLFKNPK